MSDVGGDPACWLERVCDDCGAYLEAGAPHTCRVPVARVGGDEPAPVRERGTSSAADAATASGPEGEAEDEPR